MFAPATSRRLGRAVQSPLCRGERREQFIDALWLADRHGAQVEIADLPQWVRAELDAFEANLRELREAHRQPLSSTM